MYSALYELTLFSMSPKDAINLLSDNNVPGRSTFRSVVPASPETTGCCRAKTTINVNEYDDSFINDRLLSVPDSRAHFFIARIIGVTRRSSVTVTTLFVYLVSRYQRRDSVLKKKSTFEIARCDLDQSRA